MMDQGYQMFSQFYIQPIKRVAEMIAREAARAAGSLTRSVVREGVRGVKLVGKTAGHEVYKRVVTSRYELRQLEKKKRLALDIEAEYAQRRCETYVDKFSKYIFPEFKEAGISTKICNNIRDQWIDLSAPDINPHETLMDYATLQKGYEILSKAAFSGDRLTIEEGIKDWNSLYKARMEMQGHEEEAFNKGQEDIDKERSSKNNTDERESPGDKNRDSANRSEDSHVEPDGTLNRGSTRAEKVRKSFRNDKITPDEAREMGSQVVKRHDEVLSKDITDHVRSSSIDKSGKSIKEAAQKAEKQLRKEEEKAAKMSAKEISKLAERFTSGTER